MHSSKSISKGLHCYRTWDTAPQHVLRYCGLEPVGQAPGAEEGLCRVCGLQDGSLPRFTPRLRTERAPTLASPASWSGTAPPTTTSPSSAGHGPPPPPPGRHRLPHVQKGPRQVPTQQPPCHPGHGQGTARKIPGPSASAGTSSACLFPVSRGRGCRKCRLSEGGPAFPRPSLLTGRKASRAPGPGRAGTDRQTALLGGSSPRVGGRGGCAL